MRNIQILVFLLAVLTVSEVSGETVGPTCSRDCADSEARLVKAKKVSLAYSYDAFKNLAAPPNDTFKQMDNCLDKLKGVNPPRFNVSALNFNLSDILSKLCNSAVSIINQQTAQVSMNNYTGLTPNFDLGVFGQYVSTSTTNYSSSQVTGSTVGGSIDTINGMFSGSGSTSQSSGQAQQDKVDYLNNTLNSTLRSLVK